MGEETKSKKVYATDGIKVMEVGEVKEISSDDIEMSESYSPLDIECNGEVQCEIKIKHISKKRFKKLLMSKGISRNLADKIINRFRLYNKGYTYLDVVFLKETKEFYLWD
mgnify:FL=1